MRHKLSLLSWREHEVLGLAADGLRSREIAARLGISEATVKTHLHHVYRKLGVSNRVEATTAYLRADGAGR
jgi:DNA-binding CsgD family transcriptional regulator